MTQEEMERLGLDHLGWGWGSIKRGIRSSITTPFKAVKYSFTVPYRATKAYITNKQLKGASDLTHFSGDEEVGGYSLPHRSKHYYKNPVQKTDKYGHTYTLYRWRNGSLNRLPEGLD